MSLFYAHCRFIGHLLKLLVCNNDKFGHQIQRVVKDLVANELSAAIYPILFEQIKLDVDKFFEDSNNQVSEFLFPSLFVAIIAVVVEALGGGGYHGLNCLL